MKSESSPQPLLLGRQVPGMPGSRVAHELMDVGLSSPWSYSNIGNITDNLGLVKNGSPF